MAILFSLLLALLTLAYVLYPFFRQSPVTEGSNKVASRIKSVDAVDNNIEDRILKLRKQNGKFCPRCGSKGQPDARFCRRCGANLGGSKRNV
jgi:ribosomal protein L40E